MDEVCGQDLRSRFANSRQQIFSNLKAMLPSQNRIEVGERTGEEKQWKNQFRPSQVANQAFELNLNVNCSGLADNFQ